MNQKVKVTAKLKSEKQNKKDIWSIGAYFSPTYSYRQIKNINQSTGGHHYPFISEEKPSFSYTAGITAMYGLSKRIGIVSGLNFLHIHLQSRDMIELKYSEIGATMSHHGMHGQIFTNDYQFSVNTSYGDSEVELRLANEIFNDGNDLMEGDKFDVEIETASKIDNLGIPLLLEWLLFKNKKFSGSLQSGLIVNLDLRKDFDINLVKLPKSRMSHQQTIIVDPVKNIYSLSLDYQIGLEMDYRLMNNVYLIFEPVYRRKLNAYYENQNLSSHPYNLSLFTGIRIGF